MNRIFSIIIVLSAISVTCMGQRNADYGFFAGVSSYNGDINTSKIFYSPYPAAGFFYRYNPHPRHSYRANLLFGHVSADDKDFKNGFQQNRNASFNGNVFELSGMFEFNFFPYTTLGKAGDFSPYFAVGLGVTLMNSSSMRIEPVRLPVLGYGIATITSSDVSLQPVIPFSVGFKINIHKNMGLEVEYGFRKTFYDNFDGVKDNVSPADYAVFHNNDWYSFAGMAFTWKLYNKSADCPAYGLDSKRNRKKER